MKLWIVDKNKMEAIGRTALFFNQYSKLKVNLLRRYSYARIVDIYSTKEIGNTTRIKGWVKGLRKMKGNIFLDVDDGSCIDKLQIVLPKDLSPDNLTYGSSVEASGQLVYNPNNQLELTVSEIKVVGKCIVSDGYPFAPRKKYSQEYVRQFLHLRPRTLAFGSVLRLRHRVTLSLHEFFNSEGFIQVNVPVLTGNDCEGAGEVFIVKPDSTALIQEMAKDKELPEEAFFDGKAFLTVSGQMHLEAAVRALNKVYSFGPTFRAENSKSRLHLSEFYMVEAEVAFLQDLNELISVMERLVKHATKYILDNCSEELYKYRKLQDLEDNEDNLDKVVNKPFGIESYDNMCKILDKNSDRFQQAHKTGEGFSKEHELFIVKHNDGIPVFVVDWPKEIKSFYMKGCNGDPTKVSAVDMLCPGVGELCGGSLREDDYNTLQQNLQNINLSSKLSWYLELRKYGNVPTGGFGMGFERYLQVLLGTRNIKDTIPFPRWPHNCKL